jgi:hypothetical protein
MIWLFYSLALVLSLGFAYFVPVAVRWIVTLNQPADSPEGKLYLLRIFRIGSWVALMAACAHLIGLLFIGTFEAVAGMLTGGLLAWRLHVAAKEEERRK